MRRGDCGGGAEVQRMFRVVGTPLSLDEQPSALEAHREISAQGRPPIDDGYARRPDTAHRRRRPAGTLTNYLAPHALSEVRGRMTSETQL
jgi:hypothetical protein